MNMAMPWQKNPCPWGHEIYNLGVEKKMLKDIMHFHYHQFSFKPTYSQKNIQNLILMMIKKTLFSFERRTFNLR